MSKKVGIITQHRVVNYGSVLQTYALQEKIKDMGYECEVIDYYPERFTPLGMLKRIKNKGEKFQKSFLIRNAARAIIIPSYIIRFRMFFKFLNDYIDMTPKTYKSEKELESENFDYDVYCTGSDQVWNYGWNERIEYPYYLAFARNHLAPWYTLNMIFTLFLCLCLMIAEEKISDPGKKSLVVLGIIAVSSICDWAILAPLYTLWFYRAGEDPKRRKKAFFIAALVLGITVTAALPGAAGIAAGAGAMIAVLAAGGCVLVFYNGKKSQKHFLVKKYFFYVFYPAHLVILALLKI